MEFLKNFAEYLWLITKILLMLILIGAVIGAFIKQLLPKRRKEEEK